MVDSSAVARVLGVETQYTDMRSGKVNRLPQRIAVFAQGTTAASYALTKWTSTGADAAGTRFGFGSPIHLILRELQPANGDGVGTIPVDVFPLDDHASGVVSAGSYTLSGTPTALKSYRARIGGFLSNVFTIAAGALTGTALTAATRALHDAINDIAYMPVLATYTYGTVTASALTGTGNGTITSLSVTGTPIPGAYTLTVSTAVANGGVWTLVDPDGDVVSSSVTMTPGASTATVISVGGLQFTLTDGSTDFGLGAYFTITVPATAVVTTSKWKGESANDITLEFIEPEDVGVTCVMVQHSGGAANPSVSDAIALVGNVWETMAINAQNVSDTTTLDLFQTWGEGRWGELVRKPCIVFTGNTETEYADATAVSSARRTDRINAQLVAPGSVSIPFVVAARQLARIAKVANNNPPVGYAKQKAASIVPGDDGDQWDYAVRDLAVKAGSSTIEVIDSVVNLCDIVTFYRPTGEEPPAYRQVRDIVKIQNVLYNLELIFAAQEWAAAPLIPDDQATTNAAARKPKHAKAAVNKMLGELGLAAIISDPKGAKERTTAAINGSNGNRLDLEVSYALSGNSDIVNVVNKFGFFFGTDAVVA